jgi:hypothetical protein
MSTGATAALALHAENAPKFVLSAQYTLKENPLSTPRKRILPNLSLLGETANDPEQKSTRRNSLA